jgi:ppGpp synthetase/RelA/SpoT-type nucleotidyltranferase
MSTIEPNWINQTILTEYTGSKHKFESFAHTLEQLLRTLIHDSGVRIHSVNSRVKGETSLRNKIRSNAKYEQLSDIKDIAGIRIITYFESDIDKIANIIQKEFSINEEHSVDKRKKEMPEQFGYMSLHYIVSLSSERLSLPEYRQYEDMAAELQIRSIIQHAWAEIEHDLGYKSEFEIPYTIRRSFYRLAALLEQADLNFSDIKKSLADYEGRITKIIGNPAENFGDLRIDKSTLFEYINSVKLVHRIDSKIAKKLRSRVFNGFISLSLSNRIKQLLLVGVDSLGSLNEELSRNESLIVSVGVAVVSVPDDDDSESVSDVQKGSCVLFLCYVLAAQKGLPELLAFLNQAGFSEPAESHKSFALMIMNALAGGSEDTR